MIKKFKNKKGGFEIDNFMVNIILGIVLFIVFIIMIIYLSNAKVIDTFICEESSQEANFQKGMGGTNKTGKIIFPKTFNNVPMVFTQVIGNSSNPEVIYNVNIFDITQSGFSYSKNKINNETEEDFTATDMSPSITEQFMWIAFG
jgi:hypothetical protein